MLAPQSTDSRPLCFSKGPRDGVGVEGLNSLGYHRMTQYGWRIDRYPCAPGRWSTHSQRCQCLPEHNTPESTAADNRRFGKVKFVAGRRRSPARHRYPSHIAWNIRAKTVGYAVSGSDAISPIEILPYKCAIMQECKASPHCTTCISAPSAAAQRRRSYDPEKYSNRVELRI